VSNILVATGNKAHHGLMIYRVSHRIRFEVCDGVQIVVPRGYRTNLATVPRWARWIIKPDSLGIASVIHDFLLQENRRRRDASARPLCSRWLADSVLYEAMRRSGQGIIKSAAVLLAVRIYDLFVD
jgi:hypothetical protein